MLFNREGSAQARRQNALLAMLLAGVAGAVNAMGFYALGAHTSHVSGRVAELGEALASGQHGLALAALKLLLAFFVGAVCCSVLLEASSHRRRGRHTPALLVEILTLGAVAAWAVSDGAQGEPTLALGLCFAMGLQNALITRVSGAVVRTTHVTGMVTDLGIELVHMATWVRDHARGAGPLGLLRVLRALLFAVEFERAWLHVLLLGSFLGGAVGGALAFLRLGALALALPCLLLSMLVALDLRPRRAAAPLPSAEPLPAPLFARR